MTHDEMITVIQAHRDGKTVQVRTKDTSGVPLSDWKDLVGPPTWSFDMTEYRVKPPPTLLERLRGYYATDDTDEILRLQDEQITKLQEKLRAVEAHRGHGISFLVGPDGGRRG
jgi:hypothetical protein